MSTNKFQKHISNSYFMSSTVFLSLLALLILSNVTTVTAEENGLGTWRDADHHFEIEIEDGAMFVTHEQAKSGITYYQLAPEITAENAPEDLLRSVAETIWLDSPASEEAKDSQTTELDLSQAEKEEFLPVLLQPSLSDTEREKEFRQQAYDALGITDVELSTGITEAYEFILNNLHQIEPDDPGEEDNQKEARQLNDAFNTIHETSRPPFNAIDYSSAANEGLISEQQADTANEMWDLGVRTDMQYDEAFQFTDEPSASDFRRAEEELEDWIPKVLEFDRLHEQYLSGTEYDFDRTDENYRQAITFLADKQRSMQVDNDPLQELANAFDSTNTETTSIENSDQNDNDTKESVDTTSIKSSDQNEDDNQSDTNMRSMLQQLLQQLQALVASLKL